MPLVNDPKAMVFKSGQAVDGCKVRVGLLEDSSIEAAGVKRLLEENGYRVDPCNSGSEFMELLEVESFDLLILDWNVPDLSGIEVLDKIRTELRKTIPILMLTSRASEYDIVQALNRGADDCLQKPWKPFELVARVNALLRRQRQLEKKQDDRYSDFMLDTKNLNVIRNGEYIKLSNKEFLLIQLLLRHLGSPVSRAHIAQAVWNRSELEARTVDVYVSRLRNKLNLTVGQGFALFSIYGFGYRLEKMGDEA